MKKTYYFILGNGFSINIMEKLKLTESVDLKNLFAFGDKVPYPDDKGSCFLSRSNCVDLWDLGARSTLNAQESNTLIRNIITSMNVYYICADDKDRVKSLRETIYYNAYCQLISYLKNLFIYYNKNLSDEKLNDYIEEDCNFISYIKKLTKNDCKVRIITYNYDIFLERMLFLAKLKFKIGAFEKTSENDPIIIYKPHGSISFETKNKRVLGQPFNIIKDPWDSATKAIKDLEIQYKVEEDNSIANLLIPPAGDGNRITGGWSKDMRELIENELKKANEDDECIIYGISYDHVDRPEIDKIITNIPWNIKMRYINPYPSSTFDMVLSSIFKNYCHYKNFYLEV